MKNSIIILTLLFSHFVYGQENETNSRDLENFFHWMVEINACHHSDCERGRDDVYHLSFGFDPNATVGFDDGLDVIAPPHLPPPAFSGAITHPSPHRLYRSILPSTIEEKNCRINFGCVLNQGTFQLRYSKDAVPESTISKRENSLIRFLFHLLQMLQELGTVPAIKYSEYSKNIGK